jgi:hypothetical protein
MRGEHPGINYHGLPSFEASMMLRVPARGPFAIGFGLLAAGILISACSPSKPSSEASRASELPSPVSPRPPQLWGDLKPIVSVKELMRDMLDPAADNIFDAVKVEFTRKGTVETMPRTQKDWDKIRIGAVTLVEGVYLLKIPRPFAPPGDENNSTGPEPSELSPAQIKAKLESDPVLWNAKIEALRNVGLEVLEIVKKKNAEELWEAGDNLDQACETCHLIYWYPGDRAVLQKLDSRIQELQSQRGGRRGR